MMDNLIIILIVILVIIYIFEKRENFVSNDKSTNLTNSTNSTNQTTGLYNYFFQSFMNPYSLPLNKFFSNDKPGNPDNLDSL